MAFSPDAIPYDSLGALGSFLNYLANYSMVLQVV